MARLDAVMVQQGMVPSRQRAKTLIQNGQISVNGKVCTKPAFAVSETDHRPNNRVPFGYFSLSTVEAAPFSSVTMVFSSPLTSNFTEESSRYVKVKRIPARFGFSGS